VSVSPPERFSRLRVSVEAAGSKPSVVAAQRATRRGGVLRGRPRLGGVGEEHLAGIGHQWERLERQVEVADDQVADELDAGPVNLDVRRRPTGHESVASGGQLPDEVREAPVVGWRPASALCRATVSLATFFHAIDNPLLRISGRERGERSPTCASVLRERDRLVSRLVNNPSFGFADERRGCRTGTVVRIRPPAMGISGVDRASPEG
jgi:hypothetical protein